LCEFIFDVLKVEDLKINFPYKVGVHQSCHGLRGLKLGVSSELVTTRYSKVHSLLKKAEGIELINLDREDECCGFGGTFSIFEPDISVKMGKERVLDHERNGAEIRDLSGGAKPSTHFTETFHDEGDIDMYEAMKAYIEIGFDGPMRPDHVPVMATEIEDPKMRGGYTTLGGLFATGYIKGLAESVAKNGSKA